MSEPSHEARAFWLAAPHRGEMRTCRIPAAGTNDVLVQTLFSGISRGTELLVFRGAVPPSQYEVMRCPFQEGCFPAPVKYGYAAVGRVVSGPAALRERIVFVLHPHQTRFVVPATTAVPVPDEVPAGRAILAANMETALNGLWDAEVRAGDRVCVIGAGVVGLLTAWLASRIPAVAAHVLDIDRSKAAAAAALGLSFHSDPADLLGDFDVVIHASGNPAGLQFALSLAATEAVVLEMSWFGNQDVVLPLGEGFHSRRLTLRSSQVGMVAAVQRARWTPHRRLQTALTLLTYPPLDALITGESSFDALPQVMAGLAAERPASLCHRIRY